MPRPTARTLFSLLFPLALAFAAVALLTPHVAHALSPDSTTQGFVPLADFSGSSKLSEVYASADLGIFIGRLFFAAMSLGAILAVLRLSWAGYQYMGSDLWGNKEHAKEIIRDTLLGLFLLLSIWIILYQINPGILSLEVAPSQTTQSGQTPSTSADSFCYQYQERGSLNVYRYCAPSQELCEQERSGDSSAIGGCSGN